MTDLPAINGAPVEGPLPEHPREGELRAAEQELADTLTRLTRHAAKALKDPDPSSRIRASVVLSQLAHTAAAGTKAEVSAIQDQLAARTE
jgi:hypothetical protein